MDVGGSLNLIKSSFLYDMYEKLNRILHTQMLTVEDIHYSISYSIQVKSICFTRGFKSPPPPTHRIIQAIFIGLVDLAEFEDKILLLKTPHTAVAGLK